MTFFKNVYRCDLTMRMHPEATHVIAALTKRKIHEASEMEPKTPDSAS